MINLRVLIVDECEESALRLLRELKKANFLPGYLRVETAGEFRAALREKPWEIILSDYMLPGFSAIEALALLNESGLDIPLIVVSEAIGEEAAVEAVQAGARHFILKGNLSRLAPAVKSELNRDGGRLEQTRGPAARGQGGTDRAAPCQHAPVNETHFRNLAENAKDIIFQIELKPEPHLSYISPAAQSIIGYAPQELYADFGIIRSLASNTQPLPVPGDGGPSERPLVMQCEHKDGRPVWLELYLSEIADGAGSPAAVEGIARDITERELKDRQLKQSYAKIEALSNRILSVMEEERARLARELHDQLGQVLTAVKLDLQLISEELAAFQRQKEKLAQSIQLIDTTLQLVRRQSVSLRPPTLDDMGILPALRDMCQGFMDRTGIKTKLNVKGFSERLPLDMETALYRCVQESLTNVARHAQAAGVNVQLKQTAETISIQIEDDGIGFQPKNLKISPDHIGLTGMQERVKLLHGAFNIDSEPGRGTRIQIAVPWPAAQNHEEVDRG